MPDSPAPLPARRIGFVSTRFAGTDGVSLETEKWARVLEGLGNHCFYFSGLSDRPAEVSRVVPEAFFGHPAITAISAAAFNTEWTTPTQAEKSTEEPNGLHHSHNHRRLRSPQMTHEVDKLADHLRAELYKFVQDFEIELLIVENALAIPMNIPLGLALTEFIAETGLPTIAHHHDFYWERERFLVNCVADYLSVAFPPSLPAIRHVVINSLAGQQLALRAGVSSLLIPNVMDFENPPPAPDDYAADVRTALGVQPGEIFFLQPTRVVQRKGIEHALELVKRLGRPARLVVSNASGDEGDSYEKRVREFADLLGAPVIFESEIINDQRGRTADGRKIYTLADVYPQADIVTYPSSLEGFGNGFLETVYFRRPIVVNNYSIFDVDIKPRGFRVIEFDGYITDDTLRQVKEVLDSPALTQQITDTNYQLARKHYSFAVLQRRLPTLIADCFGEDYDA
jgi:glycosyltransferase involved in cell wall biosynthesis